MKDNTRTAIGYICIALVIIAWILGGAWILSPQEFTFKIEMDNNTKEAVRSVEWEEIKSSPTYIHEKPGRIIVSDTPCREVSCPQKYQGVYTLAYCMVCEEELRKPSEVRT